jgi:acyl carrier protein
MDALVNEIKELIVNCLKLEEVSPQTIVDDEPLFREGLGLDSIDALELTVALEKKYKLSIPDEAVGKLAFASVNALATFVHANRTDR